MRVLIADDSPTILKVLELSLKLPGIDEVVSAYNGTEALATMERANPPRLVILDWQMPGLNGLEACRQIRKIKTEHRPYVILISATSTEEEMVEAFQAGVDDFLAKPIARALFQAHVKAAIRIVAYQDSLVERTLAAERHCVHIQEACDAKIRALKGESPGATVEPQIDKPFAEFPEHGEIRALVDRTLGVMNCGQVISTVDRERLDHVRPDLAAVHFIILPEKGFWLDLTLEASAGAAQVLFRCYTGIADAHPALAESADVVRETLNMIQANIRSVLRAKGVESLVPLVPQLMDASLVDLKSAPKAVYSRSLHPIRGTDLRFTLYLHASPVKHKTLDRILPADVLARDLHHSEGDEIVILNRGTFMDSHSLKKVVNLSELSPKSDEMVFEPTALVRLLADA